MNRMEFAHSCRICGRWLDGPREKARTVAEAAEWFRQMNNGMCDGCQRLRFAAAKEYEFAAWAVRILSKLAPEVTSRRVKAPSGRFVGGENSPLQHALNRMEMAAYRCEELKMWPATRAQPGRPRGREKR